MKDIDKAKKILKNAYNNEVDIANLKETLNNLNNVLKPIDIKHGLIETWTELYNINYGYNPDAYLGLAIDEGEIVVGIFAFIQGIGYSFRERFDLDELGNFIKRDRIEIITDFLYNLIPKFLKEIYEISNKHNLKKMDNNIKNNQYDENDSSIKEKQS
ncbi:MAG: hypothetical protein ACOCRX_10605 [Candidatus Woesearchaeota archaeon]